MDSSNMMFDENKLVDVMALKLGEFVLLDIQVIGFL
jgi:hypothetical protein